MKTANLIAVDADDLRLVLHALDCTGDECPPMQEVYRAADRLTGTLNDHIGAKAHELWRGMTDEERAESDRMAKLVFLRVMRTLGRRGGADDGAPR